MVASFTRIVKRAQPSLASESAKPSKPGPAGLLALAVGSLVGWKDIGLAFVVVRPPSQPDHRIIPSDPARHPRNSLQIEEFPHHHRSCSE